MTTDELTKELDKIKNELEELKKPKEKKPIIEQKHNHSGGDSVRIKHSNLSISLESGTTKTTPGTVNGWIKILVNDVISYIPCYTSKTT